MYRAQPTSRKYEEHAYVLDFNPRGKSTTVRGREGIIITAIGEDRLTLLEVLGIQNSTFEVGEKIYIGKDGRTKISSVLGKMDYEKISSSAQSELSNVIEKIVTEKRELAQKYMKFFENTEFTFFKEQKFAHSNCWLNAVICENCEAKENLLSVTNAAGVMTRPAWKIMVDLNMYSQCYRDDLDTSIDMQNRLVCLPSSILGHKHNV